MPGISRCHHDCHSLSFSFCSGNFWAGESTNKYLKTERHFDLRAPRIQRQPSNTCRRNYNDQVVSQGVLFPIVSLH